MNIIIFTHPSFLNSTSMPLYAKMLQNGMEDRGHQTEVWSPKPRCYQLPIKPLKKWLGYIDQYLIFPVEVKLKLQKIPKNTLFVFADQALGPWVPLVKNRKHIVHCHDFIAQKSALGEFSEAKTGFTGKYYQRFIRWGYKKGKNFISISKKTQKDLHRFLESEPNVSEVVYNGLNQNFNPSIDSLALRNKLSKQLNINLEKGYVMHVGGNQFYKNREGVLELFEAWRSKFDLNLPLLMVGKIPTEKLVAFKEKSLWAKDIHFVTQVDDLMLRELYQGASVFVFPSLYEGFGWPIAEAMASGCLVITTNEQPMNEVAGEAGFYIEKKEESTGDSWKEKGAILLNKVMTLDRKQSEKAVEESICQAKKFDPRHTLDQIENVYKKI